MEKTYLLLQVFTNPRDNSDYTTSYGEYASLAEAKKDAKANKFRCWVVVEQKVVARSE